MFEINSLKCVKLTGPLEVWSFECLQVRRAIQKKELHNFRHCPKLLYLPTPKANLDIISFGQFDFSLTPPPPSIIWTYFNNYVKILQAISTDT